MGRLTWEDWADLLAWRLLKAENSGRPVFLFVDDALIAEILGLSDEEEAVATFVSMVRAEMGSEESDTLFWKICVRSLAWFESSLSTTPYCLPFLAATVLAATRMAADANVAAHNYYTRLRGLLRLPGSGMPKGFDSASQTLWQNMRGWLDTTMAGDLGYSTIPEHPTFPNVGPPMSQALWRASDRAHFFDFLDATGKRPGPVGDIASLVVELKRWAKKHDVFSPGAKLLLTRSDLADLLRTTVAALAASWDGTSGTPVRTLPIHVLARPDRLGAVSLGLWAPRAVGAAMARSAVDRDGHEVRLEPIDGWYRVDLPVTPTLLNGGCLLTTDGARLSLASRPMHALLAHGELGGWLSVGAASVGRDSWLLVSERITASVDAYLGAAADTGWRTVRLPSLPGWSLYRDVRLRIDRSSPADARLAGLALPPRDVCDLRGGLPLGVARTYLVGGEPDVALLPNIEVSSVPVLIDGDLVGETQLDAPVELSDRGLAPGVHTITVGASTITLTLRSGLEATASRPATREAWREVGHASVFGALVRSSEVAPDPPDPITLRRGYHHVVLGARPGEVTVCGKWVKPRWMQGLEVEPVASETEVAFPIVWVARRGNRRSALVACATVPPDPARAPGASDDNVRLWARWIVKIDRRDNGPTPTLWASYIAAAKAILHG